MRTRLKKLLGVCLGVVMASGFLTGAAFADDWHRHHRDRGPFFSLYVHEYPGPFGYRDRPAPFFEPYELSMWSGGMWVQGWYGGQYGWWWVSGGRRYWYDRPMYPYPPYVSETWYPETVVIQQPPIIIQQPAPVVMAPPLQTTAPPPTSQSWYYCDSPAGYYPYVQTCTVPFRAVPAQTR